MIIVTTDEVPGHRITANHGLVRGNTIRAKHVGTDIVAALRNLVGGEVREYTQMLAASREQALDRMVRQATELGANAVVCVRFSTSMVMAGSAEMLVYGTAVTVAPVPG